MFVFDLDDTLYKEIDFLQSAYREIAQWIETSFNLQFVFALMINWQSQGKEIDVFEKLIQAYQLPIKKDVLVGMYRNHNPHIALSEEVKEVLSLLKDKGYMLGLITDGRTVTQKNKIRSLGLQSYISIKNIIISEEFGSEKPSLLNYLYFESLYPGKDFFYIGDNVAKDFIAPNRLGWTTLCLLDNGKNIHKQSFQYPDLFLPQYKIRSLKEILFSS